MSSGKGMRNVKKVVEKVNHYTKLRTNVQAQMAVGGLLEDFFICQTFHEFSPIFSRTAAWTATRTERHQHRRLLQRLQRENQRDQRGNPATMSSKQL